MTANRTRENRLSGMIGGLAETWARVKAIRAHNAETPKQTSLHLRLRALHFYPDPFASNGRRITGRSNSMRDRSAASCVPLDNCTAEVLCHVG
jgi:hypothetical protein